MTAASRWLAFMVVGGLGAFVQAVALVALARGVGLHYLVATALAVELAVLHNFLWHERWTWRDRPAPGLAARAARLVSFHITNGLVSMVGNLVVVGLLVTAVHAPLAAASVAGIIVTGALNFVASDRLVFAPQRWLRALGAAGTTRVAAFALFTVVTGVSTSAAQLPRETVEAWDRYARGVEARLARERQAAEPPVLSAALMSGDIDVTSGDIVAVPGGLIHHWRGRIVLAGVALEDLLARVDSPERAARRQDDVLEARVLERDGNRIRLYLKVSRKSLITVTYHTEYLIERQRDSSRSAWSRSIATKIAELENAGTPQERQKPEGRDWGFLWRLNAYWRYSQLDDGVLVELETISLSRGIPLGLGPFIRPIIDREARKSLVKTLLALRAHPTGR
jgi:putative flippase GtrA